MSYALAAAVIAAVFVTGVHVGYHKAARGAVEALRGLERAAAEGKDPKTVAVTVRALSVARRLVAELFRVSGKGE